LLFSNGTKETLLEEFYSCIHNKNLPVHENETVDKIEHNGSCFSIFSQLHTYKALRVIVAIGKSGNSRMLGINGEKLPKVFTRLIDPTEHTNENILVVGGGDSAVEAAIALAQNNNKVVLSYRKNELSRPKQQNVERFNSLVKQNKITPIFNSKVKKINNFSVNIDTPDGEGTLKNDIIYILIGTEIPIKFFKRSHIKMEGEKGAHWRLNFIAMFSFFFMLYFGKAGDAIDIFSSQNTVMKKILAYLLVPVNVKTSWNLKNYEWLGSLEFFLGWFGSVMFIITGFLSLILVIKKRKENFSTVWLKIKYVYIILAALFFTWLYFSFILSKNSGWAEEPTYLYSLLYCTTMLLFGIRRILSKPTRYIFYQTVSLLSVQIFFLFLLPFHLYDLTIALWFNSESYIIKEIFPHGKWSCFAFILFWPLNLGAIGSSIFWTWFPLIQTFVILPIIIIYWGKGGYCGWICSCGGLAETFGDEYRAKSPHGSMPKKMENIGQVILWVVMIATLLNYLYKNNLMDNGILADTLWGIYKFSIDVIFAGIIGLGCYFFYGGRIWCRFGCPLAALMHIYARFSFYRILSDKKRCISCNICTKVCHMGIDVMNFANKGIPMNDVECVRCSACIVNCPMRVLTFGSVSEIDPDNTVYKKKDIPFVKGWGNGLPSE
jgi:ferredoxin